MRYNQNGLSQQSGTPAPGQPSGAQAPIPHVAQNAATPSARPVTPTRAPSPEPVTMPVPMPPAPEPGPAAVPVPMPAAPEPDAVPTPSAVPPQAPEPEPSPASAAQPVPGRAAQPSQPEPSPAAPSPVAARPSQAPTQPGRTPHDAYAASQPHATGRAHYSYHSDASYDPSAHEQTPQVPQPVPARPQMPMPPQPVPMPAPPQPAGYSQPYGYPQQDDMTVGKWLLTFLVTSIPLVNIVMLIVWSVSSDGSETRKGWARAQLVWTAIGIAMGILLLILFAAMFAPMFDEIGRMG